MFLVYLLLQAIISRTSVLIIRAYTISDSGLGCHSQNLLLAPRQMADSSSRRSRVVFSYVLNKYRSLLCFTSNSIMSDHAVI